MQSDKPPARRPDDRLGGSQVDILAHTGLLTGRAAGSPSQSEERAQEASLSVSGARMPAKRSVVDKAALVRFVSTKGSLLSSSFFGSCARMAESSVWQSTD